MQDINKQKKHKTYNIIKRFFKNTDQQGAHETIIKEGLEDEYLKDKDTI